MCLLPVSSCLHCWSTFWPVLQEICHLCLSLYMKKLFYSKLKHVDGFPLKPSVPTLVCGVSQSQPSRHCKVDNMKESQSETGPFDSENLNIDLGIGTKFFSLSFRFICFVNG